jgi:hypothetical protein
MGLDGHLALEREKCKNLKERCHLEDQGLDGNIILTLNPLTWKIW